MKDPPPIEKIYFILGISLLFSSILTSINVLCLRLSPLNVASIVINIIQTFLTFYLIYIDLLKEYKITKYIYLGILFIILLSSCYLIAFCITTIDNNDNQQLSIASGIFGSMGILFIFLDMICSIGCVCG